MFVTVIGSEELSERYEVKISVPKDGVKPASISLLGKVLSVDLSKEALLQKHQGILEFNNNMAAKLGTISEDDQLEIGVRYEILLKERS